ncbi:hypothetical protein CPB84DRAFT_1841022 [Gymnopilus junonius]|uniref:Uncharacterized protein n=1 Tax=Gymnopilus junonius TaxID=109634 RepID=A0A9P5NZB3_GYMJU|nr:hypothetical protein CPB84DRAFT_1841022 [Gymnopilus junonius]
MPKRNHEETEDNEPGILGSVSQIVDTLVDIEPDDLAKLLAHIANRAHLPNAAFKKARTDLPSFAATKWGRIAPQLGMQRDTLYLEPNYFEVWTTPSYHLPPSFQMSSFEKAWRWEDVHRERTETWGQEMRIKFLDSYIDPIISLFQGRVIDQPEQSTQTKYSSGGDVANEFYMTGGILFLVVEAEHALDGKAISRLLLELMSAAEMNMSNDFAGLKVHGLVTNVEQFQFYSYDYSANKFYFNERFFINNTRTMAYSDMIPVANKIFGIILTAYMDGLRASINNRTGKNTLYPSQSRLPVSLQVNSLEAALTLAESCCAKFEEPAVNFQELEDKADDALGSLTGSVRSIPRASSYTGRGVDPSTSAELKVVASCVIKKEYMGCLTKPKHQN